MPGYRRQGAGVAGDLAMSVARGGTDLFRIKVCGLTRREDAELAVECGADALGFIGVVQSPRYVGARCERVSAWIGELPRQARRILVVQDLSAALEPWCDPFDGFQFFTDRAGTAETIRDRLLLRVVRPKPGDSPSGLLADAGNYSAIVVDAYSPVALGGTGELADWSTAASVVALSPVPVVLAGGLRPGTVSDAVRTVRPHAVDVSSGIEASPGVKDPVQIAAFVHSARCALAGGDPNVT